MHTYTVQFRIMGKHLDPDKITQELGLSPNRVRIAGEKRSKGKIWEESLWSYDGSEGGSDLVVEWTSLEEGLRHMIAKLKAKKPTIKRYTRQFEVFWWCGHFQSSFDGGPTLSVELLKELAEFGAEIFIDNYFEGAPPPS